MGVKERFLSALNGEVKTEEFNEDIPTMQEMSEMLTDEERENILEIIGEYERKQMNKFVEQLSTISDACYIISSTILPSLDADLLKAIYNENEEDFTSVLDTIDEIVKIISNK